MAPPVLCRRAVWDGVGGGELHAASTAAARPAAEGRGGGDSAALWGAHVSTSELGPWRGCSSPSHGAAAHDERRVRSDAELMAVALSLCGLAAEDGMSQPLSRRL